MEGFLEGDFGAQEVGGPLGEDAAVVLGYDLFVGEGLLLGWLGRGGLMIRGREGWYLTDLAIVGE